MLSNTHCTSAKAAAINSRANRKVPFSSHNLGFSLCQQFTHHVAEFQVKAVPKISPQGSLGSFWETLRAWPSDSAQLSILRDSSTPQGPHLTPMSQVLSKWLSFPQREQNKIQRNGRRTKKVSCLLYHLLRCLSRLRKNEALQNVHSIPA